MRQHLRRGIRAASRAPAIPQQAQNVHHLLRLQQHLVRDGKLLGHGRARGGGWKQIGAAAHFAHPPAMLRAVTGAPIPLPAPRTAPSLAMRLSWPGCNLLRQDWMPISAAEFAGRSDVHAEIRAQLTLAWPSVRVLRSLSAITAAWPGIAKGTWTDSSSLLQALDVTFSMCLMLINLLFVGNKLSTAEFDATGLSTSIINLIGQAGARMHRCARLLNGHVLQWVPDCRRPPRHSGRRRLAAATRRWLA